MSFDGNHIAATAGNTIHLSSPLAAHEGSRFRLSAPAMSIRYRIPSALETLGIMRLLKEGFWGVIGGR